MRIIARSALASFWTRATPNGNHPHAMVRHGEAADWASTQDVVRSFPRAKVINGERVRFPVHGGAYLLIVAFDFERRTAFVKFIGRHAAYDEIGAATVSLF